MKKVVLIFIALILHANYAWGAIVTSNTPNNCAFLDNSVTATAVFEPNEYTCANGYYLPANHTGCELCPNEHTCNGGTFTFNENVAQGIVYNHGATSDIQYGCDQRIKKMSAMFEPNQHTCTSGYFLPANTDGCAPCPTGWTCPGGTFTFNPTKYQGLQKSATYMAGDEAKVCASNYAHGIYASFVPISYTCAAGYYLPADSLGCAACLFGHTCAGGTYDYNANIDQGIVASSYTCASGYFLPANTDGCEACPHGYTCSGGTFDFNPKISQGLSRTESVYTQDEAKACASNFAHNLNAKFTLNQYTCTSGEYLPADGLACETCLRGYTCAGGTYNYNANDDQGIVINTYTCSSGEYLPADGLACETCPRGHTCAGGTYNYNANDDQGIVINTYTCSSGQYLPANALACETCPTGHTCAGGTFTFNAKDFQGLVLDTDSPIPANTNVCAENFPPSLKATYDINTYNCSAGYYLPANATECVKCLENNYCVGGSYTFNPTDNQGITHCSGDLRAPQGMWESEQCGRRFNVGGKYVYSRSTRKTSPSINLDMDLNGTTEFYINLSKIPVPMNVDFANLSQHNKLVIDLPKAYVNSVGVNVPAGKYYAYDDTLTGDVFLKKADVSIEGSTRGYKNYTGNFNDNVNAYNLSNGMWGTTFSYGKVIGESKCSTTGGTHAYTGTPDDTRGQYCWCHATGFVNGDTDTTSLNGNVLAANGLPWTFSYDLGNADQCSTTCVAYCANHTKAYSVFRTALFGQSDN